MKYLVVLAAIFISQSAQAEKIVGIVDISSIKRGEIDTTGISVSGFSSGGFMSVMMHYIFSSNIKACASFAGGPFGIGYNVKKEGITPSKFLGVDLASFPGTSRTAEDLEAAAKAFAKRKLIDPLSNLKGAPTYVYQGGVDEINLKDLKMSAKVSEMYKYFESEVKELNIKKGTHCVPTDNYGGRCSAFSPKKNGLNNCGIESIFEMFSHFLGSSYVKPESSSTQFTGKLYDFNQNPYCRDGDSEKSFMHNHGGIYVPTACRNADSKCKLHIAFHGCLQTRHTTILGNTFAVNAGYLQVADVNKMIVLFPRASLADAKQKKSNVCWDWFNASSKQNTPFKKMPQIRASMNIFNDLLRDPIFE